MKKINILIAFFGMVFILSACSDSFLDKNPSDKLSQNKMFSSQESVNGLVQGMYVKLGGPLFQMEIPLVNEVRADDILVTKDTWWPEYKEIYNYNTQTINGISRTLWYHAYSTIDAANVLIDNPLVVLSDDAKKEVLVQAHTIRAMVYLNIIGVYAKPVYDNADSPGVLLIKTSEHGKSNPRASVSEIYELIKSDLDFAETNITSGHSAIEINTSLIDGLLCWYYLNKRDYENAYKYSSKIVAAKELMTRNELRYGLTNTPSEAIFTIIGTENDMDEYESFTSIWRSGSYKKQGGRVYPEVFARYGLNDMRRDFFVDLNSWYDYPTYYASAVETSIKWNDGYHFLTGKFPPKDFQSNDIVKFLETSDHKYIDDMGTPSLGNVTFMRASEMVLTKAECAARLGNFTEAQDELFKIQKRALVDLSAPNDDSKTSAVKSTKTGNALIEEILMERRMELLGEGLRMKDILRLGKDIVRPATAWTQVINVKITDDKVILPIADTEININTELDLSDQNKGYK